jgi:NADPH:quinone reductase-like Zn-dependent oxidoreductase
LAVDDFVAQRLALAKVLAASVNGRGLACAAGQAAVFPRHPGVLRPDTGFWVSMSPGEWRRWAAASLGSRRATRFKPTCWDHGYGGFAEYVSVQVAVVSVKPASLSFEEATAVPMAAVTTLQGLRRFGALRPAQQVLINGGAGGVGSFAAQLATAYGPR